RGDGAHLGAPAGPANAGGGGGGGARGYLVRGPNHKGGRPAMSNVLAAPRESHRPATTMMRVRLKADGRIVEILPDGSERALPGAITMPIANGASEPADAAYAKRVRARTSLTHADFPAPIRVPLH